MSAVELAADCQDTNLWVVVAGIGVVAVYLLGIGVLTLVANRQGGDDGA